ncbi:MAG: AI-2E family transporter [Propionibacteriaceae bacterium]|jgi:predicted PurR-regulated permease PerM|nr:AI-2E family transporter [Propionibacteriaceae bacterium]
MVPPGLKTASDYAWRFLVVVAALAVVWLGLAYFSTVSVPVAVALLLTALLGLPATWLKSKRFRPAAATATTMGLVTVFIGAVGVLIGTTIASQWRDLGDQFTAAADTLADGLATGPLHVGSSALAGYVDTVMTWAKGSVSDLAGWAAQAGVGVGRFVAGAAITLLSTAFFLTSGRRLWGSASRLLPGQYRDRADHAALAGWNALQSYVKAQVIVAFIDAMGIFIGALVLRVPMAFALLAFTFITAFIPVVGAVLAGCLAAALAFVSGGWVSAVIMIAVTVLVVEIEGHFLQPLLLGKAAKLHPLAVLLGLAAGATIAGIVGALLVIPVLAFAFAFLKALKEEGTGGTTGAEVVHTPPVAGRTGADLE